MASSTAKIYGELPSHYRETTLRNVCEAGGIQTGPFGSQLHKKDYVASGIPIVTVEHLGDNRFTHQNLPFVSDVDAARLNKYRLKVGDVVFSRVGSVDRRAIVRGGEDGWLFSGRCLRVRPRRDLVDPFWLSYLLGTKQFREYIRSVAVGATMPSINTKILSEAPVFVPPLEDQRYVVDTIGTLDDRIDNLRQTNATLEAIAQALFKSWFVDFDPVRAKAEGREPEGMDAATAALFPSEFEDSEIGSIPKGWSVCALDEALEINPRRALKKGSVAPYLDMASVPTVGPVPTTPTQREFSSGSKFNNGDTLLARITPCLENGKTAYVSCLQDGQVGWGSTEFIVLRPLSPLPSFFAYLLARQANFRAHAIQSMSGTSGRQRIELTRLKDFLVTVPSRAVAKAFADIVEPIETAILEYAKQVDLLAENRDTLLPRLISGKLRLPDAEREIEAATA